MMPEPNSRDRDIGGFFGLEMPEYDNCPQGCGGMGILLNSGRSAFEYILRSREDIDCIWVPYYTCPTVLEPLVRLGIPYAFYTVDEHLEPAESFLSGLAEDDWLLYTNYFGIKEKTVDSLCSFRPDHLILDQSLALYSPLRTGVPAFYSPRKFSGLPDGGIAVLDAPMVLRPTRDESATWASFLFVSAELGAEAASALCEASEERLHNTGMLAMSLLTEKLMRGIDYDHARQRRLANFRFLHERLGGLNRLKIDESSVSVPSCYPLWSSMTDLRNELIDRRILIPTLWPEILDSAPSTGLEHRLALNLLPLPIDQRYTEEDMQRIIDAVLAFFC